MGFILWCPTTDATIARPLPVNLSKEDDLWRLAVTLAACSVRVVSHHLNGLRRVTAPGVLQPVPVGVRCVAGSTDPHHPGKPESEGTGRTFPAARAPFEEPSPSMGDNTSRCRRYPHEVALHQVQTRRSLPQCSALYRALLRRRLWTFSLPVAGSRDGPRPSMGFYTCSAFETEASLTHRM